MKLVERLIFGTARLSGGPYATASRRLLEDCIAAGVRAFDTAPLYGMGAAEGLVGDVAGALSEVAIHTKAGLPSPPLAGLRGWGKAARAFLPRTPAGNPRLDDYSGPSAHGRYGAGELAHSIAASRRKVRRDRLDLLLLHGAEWDDIAPEARAVFERELAEDRATAIGVAHAGPAHRAAHGLVRQIVPRSEDFVHQSEGPVIFHSVRGATWLALREGGEAARAIGEARAAIAGEIDSAAADYLAGLLALARTQPDAGLIFATTSRERLAPLLALAQSIDVGKV